VVKAGFRKAPPEVVEDCIGAARSGLGVLEAHLKGRSWLVGEGVTIADIDLYGVVSYAGDIGVDLADYPALKEWVGRMEALPGFAAAKAMLPMESRAAA
jgi:glutathione S-transferase